MSQRKNDLPVVEIFDSIQGEGPFCGRPSVFLRFAFCNLRCKWCDSEYTWKRKVNFMWKSIDEIREKILRYNIKHLVITGGEPLLWERIFFPLVEDFLKMNFRIEIETNGTIQSFLQNEVYFNVSPKLSNSGNSLDKRIKVDVLKSFNKRERVIFKFVIKKESDLVEVIDLKEKVGIENSKIFLMPEGKSYLELRDRRKLVYELSRRYGFRFTDRFHILMGVK
ncbi:MAG: 7-carboxy-7-deazaguanine synthase QueE [Candidatus Hydrothermales bacterium]